MKTVIVSAFFCLVLGWSSLFVSAQAPAKAADLAWFAGCWEIRDSARDRLVSEQWMMPAGGVMLGMSRTVRNGKVTVWEFTRILEKDDAVFYVAKPSQNAAETFFKLVKFEKFQAVFEDPKHDFPQRVIYRRDGDKLNARIEGMNAGKFLGIDYPFVKVSCN